MSIIISYANKEETHLVINFFEQYVDSDNDGVYSKEFLCPYGIKSAIIKQEIILAKENDKIVGALRFYRQKRKEIISLYQFAVANNLRGRGLIQEMLRFTQCPIIHSRCIAEASFNNYYLKTGRILLKEDKLGKQRQLEL